VEIEFKHRPPANVQGWQTEEFHFWIPMDINKNPEEKDVFEIKLGN